MEPGAIGTGFEVAITHVEADSPGAAAEQATSAIAQRMQHYWEFVGLTATADPRSSQLSTMHVIYLTFRRPK